LPLKFIRSHRSGVPSFGAFGWNWSHNFNLYVRELNNGDVALWRNLREERFTLTASGFEPPRGVFEKLEREVGLTERFSIEARWRNRVALRTARRWNDPERIPLLAIEDRHGNHVRLTYDSEDRVAEVRDDDDRFFMLNYDACGLLIRVADQAGRGFTYEHDEQMMQLIRVTSPAITGIRQG
jgi:YD repeat-containing protein